MANKPKVSVVIPCYNQAKYLHRSIGSVLKQTMPDWELIIVNDGSTDDTSEVVNGFKQFVPDSKIRLIEQENRGLSGARNTGFKNAKADWVLPLDADDFIRPKMLYKCLEKADKTDADVVFTDIFMLKEDRVKQMFFDKAHILKYENTIVCSSLVRKSLWEDVGGYDESMREGYEDWEFWISCIEHDAKFVRKNGDLFIYDNTREDSMVKHSQQNHCRIFDYIQRKHPKTYKDKIINDGRGVTVVLSSYNQRETIEYSLESLRHQTMLPRRVVIADDGSSDDTLAWIDSLDDSYFPFKIRYVTREHEWYRLASINNLGAKYATGSRVLFTNGDQVHCPTSIESHFNLSDTEIGGGIFKGINMNGVPLFKMEMLKDFNQVVSLNEKYPSAKNNLGYMQTTDPNVNPIGVWGGNFSIPLNIFRKVNGYDEKYDVGWGGEENDIVSRCVRAGGRVKWVMDSVIYHLDHPLRGYAYQQLGSKKYVKDRS